MDKQNRIHWKKGMDITHEVFVASDNYHITERNQLGRFLASRLYGILPDSHFYIEHAINNNNIRVQNLECLAISNDGYVINIQKDTPFCKELQVQETTDATLYVVLTINLYPAMPVDENELYIYPEYNLILKRTDEPIEQGIPIGKIYKNGSSWEVDKNYIPPSIALNAVEALKHKFFEIKNSINKIVEKIVEKISDESTIYLQTILLQLELDNFSNQKTPEELMLLMKKFCWIFQYYLKTSKNIEELPLVKYFLNQPYNHHEIEKILHSGLESLVDVYQKLDEKPAEVLPEFDEIKI